MPPETQFDAAELTLLYGIAQRLLSDGEYGELLTGVLDAAIEALAAERGFVVVCEGGSFNVTCARNFRTERLAEAEREISGSIATEVATQRRALLIADALNSDQFGENPSVRRMALRSVLCAPLVASDAAYALIYLERRDISNHFTDRHRQLLDQICALAAPRLRVAVAIEEARQRAQALAPAAAQQDGILTADPALTALLRTLREVAATELPVLIEGETGTGKELLARTVYRHSPRAAGPFVVLNCAAIPATLVESELFGYMRGAFTGATRDRVGLIGAAHRGTLFLDEIGDLPLELQPRLLRVLQSGEYTRLGSTRMETADVRIVAATNRNLEEEVAAGRFRSDLYYRLAGVTLKIPPLRQRPHDVQLLADHFLRVYATRFGKQPPRLGNDGLQSLVAYSFPGNVRELEGEIARLVAVSAPGATIGVEALTPRLRGELQRAAAATASEPSTLEQVERRHIQAVLQHTGGNRTRAAELLGISREGLRTKMQRLGLTDAG